MANFRPWTYDADPTRIVAVEGAPTKPKKLTGSRFGAVVGLNNWKSPFEAWCEVCRVGEQPFEGNKYTDAGNAIESKLIEWCKTEVSPYIYTPEEFYGVPDAKRHTGYDFYDHPIFGGMWDAIVLSAPLEKFRAGNGSVLGYIEAKTSSRPQDWQHGVPDSYAVQGLEYCVLDGATKVFFPVAILDDKDYENPSAFVCTEDNTFLYDLDTESWKSRDGKTIRELMDYGQDWWVNHVVGNVSPCFDEKADKKILTVIRKTEFKSEGLEALAKEAVLLEARIELIKSENGLPALEKALKKVKDQVKAGIVEQFTAPENTDKDTLVSFGWRVKKSTSETVDKAELREAGLEKFIHTEDKYTMTKEKE
jgi:predicted phage-related endonuclease